MFRWFAPLIETARCSLFFLAEKLVLHVTEHEMNAYELDREMVTRGLRVVYFASTILCALLSVRALAVRASQFPKVRQTVSKLYKRLVVQRSD